jgi:hypothetical protein
MECTMCQCSHSRHGLSHRASVKWTGCFGNGMLVALLAHKERPNAGKERYSEPRHVRPPPPALKYSI